MARGVLGGKSAHSSPRIRRSNVNPEGGGREVSIISIQAHEAEKKRRARRILTFFEPRMVSGWFGKKSSHITLCRAKRIRGKRGGGITSIVGVHLRGRRKRGKKRRSPYIFPSLSLHLSSRGRKRGGRTWFFRSICATADGQRLQRRRWGKEEGGEGTFFTFRRQRHQGRKLTRALADLRPVLRGKTWTLDSFAGSGKSGISLLGGGERSKGEKGIALSCRRISTRIARFLVGEEGFGEGERAVVSLITPWKWRGETRGSRTVS